MKGLVEKARRSQSNRSGFETLRIRFGVRGRLSLNPTVVVLKPNIKEGEKTWKARLNPTVVVLKLFLNHGIKSMDNSLNPTVVVLKLSDTKRTQITLRWSQSNRSGFETNAHAVFLCI